MCGVESQKRQKRQAHSKSFANMSASIPLEYDLRVVFQFVKQKGVEAILLEAVGTHDEVY